jgi:hypothetical protein
MAKKRSSRRRHHNAHAGSHHRRRKSNPFVRHHRRRTNPLPISTHDIPATIGGALAGGVASSWIPDMVLGSKNSGVFGYLGNLAVAIGGALLLQRYRNLSLGWFIGGLTMAGGRIIDDLTGKQVAQFNMPLNLGVGSYYKSGYVPLPTTTEQSPFLLPAAPVAVVRAGSPNAAKKGMGWAPRFSSRFAA